MGKGEDLFPSYHKQTEISNVSVGPMLIVISSRIKGLLDHCRPHCELSGAGLGKNPIRWHVLGELVSRGNLAIRMHSRNENELLAELSKWLLYLLMLIRKLLKIFPIFKTAALLIDMPLFPYMVTLL